MTEPRDTTALVRRARGGDADGVAELVEHLSPLLRAQARFRLARKLPGVEPDEVVQEVWLRALPALPDLDSRDGRFTPVLVRYLSTTLLHYVNELVRSEIRARRAGSEFGESASFESVLAADTVSVVSRAIRRERKSAFDELLDSLDARDRELLVLRGIEQHDNKDVAGLLGETPNAVSLRYNRLLERLRRQLRNTVLDEL